MECDDVREALSATLDGEDPGLGPGVVEHHLARCAPCAAWSVQAEHVHRMVRVRGAEAVPDLSAAIVDSHLPAPAGAPLRLRWAGSISGARWSLLVVAMTQLVLAGPALVLGDDPGASVHVARELGAFDVALAVGLLVAAWQPARAWGLLPVALALGFVVAGTAAFDVLDGRTSTVAEAHHVLDLAGVGLLWIVAREQTAAARPLGEPGLSRR